MGTVEYRFRVCCLTRIVAFEISAATFGGLAMTYKRALCHFGPSRFIRTTKSAYGGFGNRTFRGNDKGVVDVINRETTANGPKIYLQSRHPPNNEIVLVFAGCYVYN